MFKIRNTNGSTGNTEEIIVSRSPHIAGPPVRLTISTYGNQGPSRAIDAEISFTQAEELANYLLEMIESTK